MVVTVCVAIKQSVKSVAHDCNVLIDLDVANSELGDEAFLKILSTAAPMAMRKSGRVAFVNLVVSNNGLTDRSIEELANIVSLNKEAKYKYKAKDVLLTGCIVDLSRNKLTSISLIESLLFNVPSIVLVNLENNMLQLSEFVNSSKATLCAFEDSNEDNCAGTRCTKKCRLHLTRDSLETQRVPETPLPEPIKDLEHSASEMTKALLAGLKITPPSSEKKEEPTATEDISKSLLNLLHASASKLRTPSVSETNPSPPMNQTVQNLFAAASAGGRSLSDIEATFFKQPATVPQPKYTAVRAPLKVFTPFPGATPLCGLELRVDPLGYRVVRVTEKPGQEGNIREGDVITAIDGEPLVALPGVSETDREKHIRTTFGKRLKDGVQLIIQRPVSVGPEDLSPEQSTAVERRLDFGLMLLGAGIDWRSLITKLPVAQQQAAVICQTLGIEGKLEFGTDSSPLLVLKGPLGLVDKAMRQFCVVIVKAALVQQQTAAANRQ